MIVFFGRIKTLQYVEKLLQKEGIRCLPFHSQMNQQKREQQLNLFKSGKIPILLATDIAARGIHCNNIEYIINYDFPSSLEQYVHRCGRAGRNQQVHGNDGNGSDGNAKSTQSSTVYSFFHRELAPMAKDVVDLLTKCKSWIDPNLLALVPGSEQSMEEDAEPPKRKRRKRDKETSVTMTINDKANYFENDTHVNMKDTKVVDKDDHDDDEDDDEFASLVQNRIIFKRASHVKDDSDGDDESINQD
jgi:ATP-dependent RNA helicase DDX5/DBP2